MINKLFIASFALALLPLLAPAQVNYGVDGGTAYVTNSPYASGNVVIASTYSGYPVTTILYAAFDSCTNLTSVSIPDSVTNIGGWVFTGCSSLTNITVAAANPTYSTIQGVLFDKAQTTLMIFPPGRDGDYAIPDGTTEIAGSAFEGCASLTSVAIPDGVTNIWWLAFAGCTSLTSVMIPDSVIQMGGAVFSGCASLVSVTLPDSVISIEDFTFSDCISLTNVAIGSSVASIGESAFYACHSLTSVVIPDSVTSIGNFAFNFCTGLTSVTIGSGVYDGLEFEFYDAGSLTNITVVSSNLTYSSTNGVLFNKGHTELLKFPQGIGGSYLIPASVIYIGYQAFAFCTSLTNVAMPDSVTSIGYRAFNYCRSLINLTIGNNVTTIGSEAFIGCTNLTSLTIPTSVIFLSPDAFNVCYSLTNITVAAGNTNYSSINGVLFNKAQTILLRFPQGLGGSYVIPNTVLYIWGAFANCSRLLNVVIPNNVIHVGASAFNSCAALTNVTIGNRVANIGQSAFNACVGLTTLTIPASVTNIGNSTFSASVSLTNLTFLGDCPVLGSAAFSGVAAGAKVNYYYGNLGWGATYGGLPTVMLHPQPQIGSGSTGLNPGGLGFSIAGIPDLIIVVEASTNLANWQPIWTNTLSGASVTFTDSQWTNYPNRFYRVGGRLALLLVTNLSGALDSQTNFVVTVPAGKTSLQISTSGGTGDCDLYVRFGAPPTLSTWDYRPYLQGNNESVTISNLAAGDWHIMVHGFENYSGVMLRAK